jgi:histidine triad (HIT) family protein
MSTCLFCNLAGTSGDRHVLSTLTASAFLDKSPLFFGHVLVVPTAHAASLDELPDADVGPFFLTVKRVARAVERASEAQGTFVAINNKVSQSVPHLHVHVVPRNPKDGLRGLRFGQKGKPRCALIHDSIGECARNFVPIHRCEIYALKSCHSRPVYQLDADLSGETGFPAWKGHVRYRARSNGAIARSLVERLQAHVGERRHKPEPSAKAQ